MKASLYLTRGLLAVLSMMALNSCAARRHLGPDDGSRTRAVFQSQINGEAIGLDGVAADAAHQRYKKGIVGDIEKEQKSSGPAFSLRSN